MTTGKRTLAALVSVVVVGFTAGCGSDDDSSKKPASMADAKATLSKDCQDGKSSDKKLCDCVADKLEAGGKTAKQILALNEQVKDGKIPTLIGTVIADCTKQTAG